MEFDFDGQSPRAQTNAPEFTVSELSGKVKNFIESEFSYVRVRGELGRVSRPASGHVYLDLKDDRAVISGVIWRAKAAAMAIQPEQGLEVIAVGKLTTFPGQSKYQIVIDKLEPAGQGALMALLEERKKKLAAEGLFAEERKRRLPFMPRVIGIVTSPSGAVIRDMMHGFRERFPVHVMVWPVRVQGETSAREVAAAIEGFNRITAVGPMPRPDVLIVARGGGSLEDLWSFNEEIVARAAAMSDIPLISAVGHETDWTLIDYAADARAPTPTKAAEWAVPRYSELVERLDDLKLRHLRAQRRRLEMHRTHLKGAARGLPRLMDLVGIPRQRLDGAGQRLAQGLSVFARAKRGQFHRFEGRLQPHLLSHRLQRGRERAALYGRSMSQHLRGRLQLSRHQLTRLEGGLKPRALMRAIQGERQSLAQLAQRQRRAFSGDLVRGRQRLSGFQQLLQSLSYQSVLKRGFAIIRDEAGQPVRQVVGLAADARLEVELQDGRIWTSVSSEAGGPDDGAAGSGGKVKARKSEVRGEKSPKKAKNDDTQGSLF